jgi:hypothetical protein
VDPSRRRAPRSVSHEPGVASGRRGAFEFVGGLFVASRLGQVLLGALSPLRLEGAAVEVAVMKIACREVSPSG